MTEAEWLAAIDPVAMLAFVRGKTTERKLRLFAVACCRRIAEHITHPDSVAAVDLADALQDAGCDHDAVLAHCRKNGDHARGCWVVDLLTCRS
ncbi:MAG TPA: hypothetical protein VMZ71_09740 [Gemmataceae bacterium]|nr:hypothetical protein [Gemmataceae bacterium]